MTIIPPYLRPGDKVAILSPASKIDPALIDGAAASLIAEGFTPVVMPHAAGVVGSFSGSRSERLADLTDALADDEIRCILCSRGGYGAVHLLRELDSLPDRMFRKWLVGFSDISALHALWRRKGVASLHAAMAKHIAMGDSFPSFRRELGILRGTVSPDCSWDPHPYNNCGEAAGPLVGGNLAVIGGLFATPFSPLSEPGAILMIEDVAEPIYKVERMLWQLRLSGDLANLAGLVIGQFTDYRPSADWTAMEDMLHNALDGLPVPVAFGAPFGHIPDNHPLLINRRASLSVGPAGASLRFS